MKKTLKVILAIVIVATMTAMAMIAVSAETEETKGTDAAVESEILTVGALSSAPAEEATDTDAATATATEAVVRPTAPISTPKTADNGLAVVALAAVAALGAAVVVAKKHN